MTDPTATKEEQLNLDFVYPLIETQLSKAKQRASEYAQKALETRGDPDLRDYYVYNRGRMVKLSSSVGEIERWLESLYFGRVDFTEVGGGSTTAYIGVIPHDIHLPGLSSLLKTQNMVLVDWRAPVADLYYSRMSQYKTPKGVVKVHLKLVRNVVLKRDKVNGVDTVFETDGVQYASGLDPLLQRQLGRYGRERFLDLVRSIQSEQNQVIRESFGKHLVIQGLAGTGKTIVLLHRVAYCLYVTSCAPEDVLVLAPSKLLLDQVNQLLPNLFVNKVCQVTFEDFAREVLGGVRAVRNLSYMPFNIWQQIGDDWPSLKDWAELRYGRNLIALLDEILDRKKRSLIEGLRDISVTVGSLLITITSDEIAGILKDELSSVPYELVRSRSIERLSLKIGNACPHYEVEVNKREIRAAVEAYLSFLPDPKQFLESLIQEYRISTAKIPPPEVAYQIPQWTLEDWGALLYLYLKTYRPKTQYRYIFVDEAHALSPIWLIVLKEFLRDNGTMTLAGDAFQLSPAAYGMLCADGTWKWVIDLLGSNRTNIIQLNISYRVTEAIMDRARWALTESFKDIAQQMKSVRSECEWVKRVKPEDFVSFVQSNPDIKTAAIICPTNERLSYVKGFLDQACRSLHGGKELLFLTVEQAGGLEFDAVLVDQVDFYQRQNSLHARALYTAITRAVHYLFIT